MPLRRRPRLPQPPLASLPHDLRGGVHADLLGPGTATFILSAPYKPFVSLVGDFNEWDTRAHPLLTNGQGLWWTTIPHPGPTRYGYYVAVDQESHAWVGDPYATRVSWDADGPKALLAAPAPPFRWTDGGWRTPPLRDMVIYELCVRDFGGRWVRNVAHMGNLGDVQARLDYLKNLGVNAIELMPIQAFPGDSSWGYNPVFYFAVANSYGDANDLKRLVNACHRRGMAVILDVAFNHAWGDHPYYRMYPPLYGPNGEWLADWNPFFHHTPQAINGWGGLDWDHFAPETTRYFQDVVRYWLTECRVDGFRFDWVGGVDYDSRNPLDPGFNPYHGIAAIAWAARQANPSCVLIAEYWQLEGTHPDKTAAKLVRDTEIDAVWNGDFHHTVDEVLNQRWEWEKKDIFRAVGGFRDLGFRAAEEGVNFTASHDEVRPEHEIQYYTYKNLRRPGGMSVRRLALARALLGLTALFAGAGVPMIYSGQEYGDNSPRTIDFVPLQWGLLRRAENKHYFDAVRRLIHARLTCAALQSDHIEFAVEHFAQRPVLRFRRWDEQGRAAVVALNFSPRRQRIELHFPYGGKWQNVVTGRTREVAGGALELTFGPFAPALFIPV